MSQDTSHVIVASSLADVPAEQWNALAGNHPAVRHEFLYGLEISGCAAPGTGWTPQHLLLYREDMLAAAMPLYLKSHSRGEYIFDYAWAHAFHRHGLPYYPKLLCAVPFTPVPGPRLLARDDADRQVLLQAALALADRHSLSSLHILFPHEADLPALEKQEMMLRSTVQFHWSNQGYGTMDDFLRELNQKNRKKMRQGRRKLAEQDVHFRWLEGRDIGDAALEFFYRCYYQTYIEHGNPPYLNLEFFRHLHAAQPDSLVLVLAQQEQQDIAAALYLRSGERLYGRYWGSLRFVSGLHFETCYMQGIEYAIARGISVFEGGAQGEHKLARGLLPVRTFSAHWIRDPRFARAIDEFLAQETSLVGDYMNELEYHSPYRLPNGSGQ